MAIKDNRCDCPVRSHYVHGIGWVDRCKSKGTTFVMAHMYTRDGYIIKPVFMCTRHRNHYMKYRYGRAFPHVGRWSHDGHTRYADRTDFGDDFDGVVINGKKIKAGVY